MQPSDSASLHPIDRLIVRLIREEADAIPDDLDLIVQRIASAPFNRRPVRVRVRDRGLTYGDVILGPTADSLELHLAKRVRGELQWAEGTTAEQFVDDLRSAARHPLARILVYERSGDVCAATMSPTTEIVPIE